MRLSYYCYDTAMCQDFLDKMYARFGTVHVPNTSAAIASADFMQVASPERADFILFPFDIGILIALLGVEQTENMLASNPLYAAFQAKHVLFDYGDTVVSLPTQAIVFKVSMCFPHATNYFPLWYATPPHVTNDHYVLDFKNTKYDICFIGTNSNPLRKAACVSLQHSAALRVFIDLVEGNFENGVFFAPRSTDAEKLARQELFRKSIKMSKCSFCPPGLGPHSVRFYESLYYGRIPVVVTDTNVVFPFHTTIDYTQFSLNVPRSDIVHIGDIVADFLFNTSTADLRGMSVRACQTYHRFFANDKIPKYIHATLCACLKAYHGEQPS